MKTAVGFSDASDLDLAVRAAAKDALAGCPEPSLVLFFATHSYGRQRFEEAVPSFAGLVPEGAIRAGGIVNGLAFGNTRCDAMFNKFAVAVVAIGGSDVRVAVSLGGSILTNPAAAGRAVAEDVKRQLGHDAVEAGIVFPPGLGVGVPILDQYVLNGISEVLPKLRLSGCGFTSGMRLDGLSEAAIGFLGDRIEENGTLLIAFEGIDAAYAISNGSEDTGRGEVLTVTEADGNLWTRAVEGVPRDVALDVLAGDNEAARTHFSNNPAIASVEHTVTLAQRDGTTSFFWAQPPGAFTPDGKVVGLLPFETQTPLSLVNIDSVRAIRAVEEAADLLGGQVKDRQLDLVIAFSCAMRGFTLGARVSEESGILKNKLDVKDHLVIVANGEIGCRPGGPQRSTVWAYSACGFATKPK